MNKAQEDFTALLERVSTFLMVEQRVSYRGLKRQFGLDDEDIEDIKDELIHARQIAADEGGRVLVWRDDTRSTQIRLAGPASIRADSYTPNHLAEKILSIRSAIEGEKKQVTVMFCDIAKSMELAERLGPENWHAVINEFFALLSESVHFLEGTINQYTGDGIMALFGAPLAAEDHALRACMAGLRICANLRRFNERLRADYGESVSVRIGLNSGEVVVGTIGDDLRMDYTAQGQVVGIASRMETMSESDSVTVSEFTARLVGGLCELQSLGTQEVKGVSSPVEMFRLISAQATANRFDISRRRGLSRFVGREAELVVLEAALQQTRQGQAQVIGLVAEPGTGKSRLCHEFLQLCEMRGMTVLRGNAVPHGKNIPNLPMLQVFRSYYQVADEDSPEEARAKIHRRMATLDASLLQYAPLVNELLGVSDADHPVLQMDPDAKQRQLFSVLRKTLQFNDPEVEGIVTCIEDLHWLDPASELFLEQWVEAAAGSKAFLLLSYRPEFQARWMRLKHFRAVPLAPLEPADVKELLHDVLGDHESTAGLAEKIYRRSGGNPFFCEEIVQALRESGDLTLSSEIYRLNKPLDDLRIPASVQSLLASRIDRLHAEYKTVLQIASIIGRDFSLALLRNVAELSEERMLTALDTLIKGEFLVTRQEDKQLVYSFKHALTQEVARNSQLNDRLRQVHAMVARGIELLHSARRNEMAALAAYHWDKGGQSLLAAQAYKRAADHVGPGMRAQEMNYLRRALTLTEPLEVSEERQMLRLQMLTALMSGGAWRFDMSDDELESLAAEARALAEDAGMIDLAALVRAGHMAALGMMRGDVQRWGPGMDAIAALLDQVSAESQGAVMANHSYSQYVRGQLVAAERTVRAANELAKDHYEFGRTAGWSILAAGKNCLALIQASNGQLAEALEINRTGIIEAEAAGLVEELIWQLCNQSDELYAFGYAPQHPWILRAVENAKRGRELAEQVASDFTRGLAMRGQAFSLLLSGDFAGSEAAALRCLAHCRERRAHLEVEAECLAVLAEARLGQGKYQQALETAAQARELAREQGAKYFEGMAQLIWIRSRFKARGGASRIDQIKAALQRAQAIVDETGGHSLQPQIHEQQARLEAELGDQPSAIKSLHLALRAARSIGAEGHAERLSAELSAA